MNVNVQGTSVWAKINFIVNKIRPASKLLKDVMEHKIVILERMRLDVNVRLTNSNATLEEGASCPARFAMAILTAQTVLMNGTVLSLSKEAQSKQGSFT